MSNDLDFVQYLDYLKGLENFDPDEYKKTKKETLQRTENLLKLLNSSDIPEHLKKKCFKNIHAMREQFEKIFKCIDDAREISEKSPEEFDKELFSSKIECHLDFAEKNVQNVKKIISIL